MDKNIDIPKHWSFSGDNVAQGFDAHVKNELPWYDLATWAIGTIGSHFIPDGGLIYDIGASTGNIGRILATTIEDRKAHLIALDNQKSMEKAYSGGGEFVLTNALDYEFKNFDFATLFLTMMFMPISKRAEWLKGLRGKLNKGGCIVVFDKCEPTEGFLSTALYRMTLDAKVNAGVSYEDIVNKELSLKGVQRPLMPDELPPDSEEIFRFGHFAGWCITNK